MTWHAAISALTSFGFHQDTDKPIGFLETWKNPANFKKSLKFQIKKMNGGIVELLIPTLNKIIRSQDIYFVVIINNRLKIISVHGTPLWSIGGFFPKKSFSWGDKRFFGQKKYGEVVLNWRTNDQIMPRFGKSFINYKCIFQ